MILHTVLVGVLGVSTTCGSLPWDDEYGASIAHLQAATESSESEARESAAVVRQSMWGWEKSSDYHSIRATICERFNNIVASARLEIGSEADGEYQFVWVIQDETGAVVYANLTGSVVTAPLVDSDWEALLKTLRDAKAWTLRTTGDFAVYDGASYFMSVFVPEGHGQFAVYAPALSERGYRQMSRQEFAVETVRHTSVITQMLRLAKPKASAE